MTRALVIIGVSGAGKTTLGVALAKALGWNFVEGDTLHPSANVAKMAAGKPLDDDDVPQTVEVRTVPATEAKPATKPSTSSAASAAPRANGAASETFMPVRAPDDPGIDDDEPAPRAKPAAKTGTAA